MTQKSARPELDQSLPDDLHDCDVKMPKELQT